MSAIGCAGQPSMSRRIRTARCRAGTFWTATMNVSSMVSRAAARTWESRKPAQGSLVDGKGIPVRLWQRVERGGVRRPVRELDHPVTGEAAVPGSVRKFRHAFTSQDQHANEDRGPLLLISGLEDHTVPDVVTRSTLKQDRDSTAVTELKQ